MVATLGGVTTARDAFGNPTAGFDDNIFIDYTLTKKFNKFEVGVIGYYETDINGPLPRQRALAVGGLVGYDFGKFTLQAFATREVLVRQGGWGWARACSATRTSAAATLRPAVTSA